MADRGSLSRPGVRTDRELGDWNIEETYWRDNWQTRPYATADRGFDFYRPAYRYGFESAQRNRGREFDDVAQDLEIGWETYEYRNQSKWAHVKEAVRDGWNRLRHR
ncbi:MAG TPA: hypothetical protein VIP11_25260 [Gemmatimonadaceae bacterium]